MIKDQEVLLLLSVQKTLSLLSSDSSCLQLLPAQKELNRNQEISRRGREDLVGRTVLPLRHSHLPARPEKVVLVEVGRGKERVSNIFLSFFAASSTSKTYPKSENHFFFCLCGGGNYRNLFSPLIWCLWGRTVSLWALRLEPHLQHLQGSSSYIAINWLGVNSI